MVIRLSWWLEAASGGQLASCSWVAVSVQASRVLPVCMIVRNMLCIISSISSAVHSRVTWRGSTDTYHMRLTISCQAAANRWRRTNSFSTCVYVGCRFCPRLLRSRSYSPVGRETVILGWAGWGSYVNYTGRTPSCSTPRWLRACFLERCTSSQHARMPNLHRGVPS